MNYYVDLIKESVDFIEARISEKLTLKQIARHFGVSDFHYNRIFKSVSGETLKQYILGRKLTVAKERLLTSNDTILEIALDLGFEYPEVFSRAFNKQFGISPTQYRKDMIPIEGVSKIHIVERNIMTCGGNLLVKGEIQHLQKKIISGVSVTADIAQVDFEMGLRTKMDSFLDESTKKESFDQSHFYTVVSCHDDESTNYTVFCGKEYHKRDLEYDERVIPSGWYATFQYSGDMYKIKEVLEDDIYKWIMMKSVKLQNNGIGMVNIYDGNYPENPNVKILIPIQNEQV